MIKIKQKLFRIAEIIHLQIFRHEMGEEMRKFLNHLTWSFLGGTMAATILFILTILAGRWLGPIEYGKYSLIIAITSIFVIPMTMGIDTALVYFIAQNKSYLVRKEIVASSLWMVGCFILLISLSVFLLKSHFVNLFGTQEKIIKIAIIFSILLSLRNIFDAILKGFYYFKFQSLVKIIEALIIIGAFFSFIKKFNWFGFESYVGAILMGYSFTIFSIFWVIKKMIGFNIKYTGKIISYGVYAITGSFLGIMTMSFDKILINKYLGAEQLGIYNAYLTISILLVCQFVAIFINVFFPYLASIEDSTLIFKKINKLIKIFFIPGFLILGCVISGAIMLFGKEYKLDWLLVGEFSFLGIMTMYFTVLWWLIASRGIKGIRFTSFNGIIAGVIFMGLMFFFRETLNLYCVVLFLIISSFYTIIIALAVGQKMAN